MTVQPNSPEPAFHVPVGTDNIRPELVLQHRFTVVPVRLDAVSPHVTEDENNVLGISHFISGCLSRPIM